MHLNIVTIEGKTVGVHVSENTTIGEIKKQFSDGYSSEKVKIIYDIKKFNVIDDSLKISETNLTSGSKLYVIYQIC